MAGHSKFANIKHRKNRQDELRAKMFTKLQREILVAATTGGIDSEYNPRLRTAIMSAKKEGMPKDKIDTVIKSSQKAETSGAGYEEVIYEGYGPAGVAVVMKILTNNRNRTAATIREAFSRAGGSLGVSGSVLYMFSNLGIFIYKKEVSDFDNFFELVENDAENVDEDKDTYIISCQVNNFNKLSDLLSKKFGEPEVAKIVWQPNEINDINDEKKESMFKLIELLEDNDDVQEIFHNCNL